MYLQVMDRHTKVQILTLVALLLVGESFAEKDNRKVFKGMVQWLNAPTEEALEGVANQQVPSVPKDENFPAETVHAHKEYNDKILESEEYESDHSTGHKGYENSIGQDEVYKDSKSEDHKGHHNRKGKDYKEHKHKDKDSAAENSASHGHKGHSIKSKGHTNKGENEEGFQKAWHKAESRREKKFFDNGEELRYSSEHDHLLAHHKVEGKGGFKSKAKKGSHLHDNHGKKHYKNRVGDFDKVHKEKDSHGRRKDYGEKSESSRKGAHEGSFKSSKGNAKGTDFGNQGSHSLHRPIKLTDGKKRKARLQKDIDIEDPVEASDSSNVPLSTVLESSGYAKRRVGLSGKKDHRSSSASNINKVLQKPRLIPITNENESQERQPHKSKNKPSKIHKPRNKSRRVPIVKKNIRNKASLSETEEKYIASSASKNDVKYQKDDSTKRIKPIVNKRLRNKVRFNTTKTRDSKPKKETDKKKLISIKTKQRARLNPRRKPRFNSAEENKIFPESEGNNPPVSLFVLNNSLPKKKVKFSKIVQAQHDGHKKHRKKLFPKQVTEKTKEETNEIDDRRNDRKIHHPSGQKPVIISDPFLTPIPIKNSSEDKKLPKHSKKLFKDSYDHIPKPQNTEEIVIKPLKKNKASKENYGQEKKPQHANKFISITLKEENSEEIYKSTEKPPKEYFVTVEPLQREFSQNSNEHVEQTKHSKTLTNKSPPEELPQHPREQEKHSKKSTKPLQKERSRQINVISSAKLESSPSHKGYHTNDKPKKYAKFQSHDEGHHKEAGEKVEKGGFEESGYKGNSERDHGKLHDSKFIDRGKKAEKGNNHEKHHDGHYDKGQKGSKGHAHGKKSNSHKGHTDKGFKNVHHKLEYSSKKNYYHDDDSKKSHNVFDDFDVQFEKKRQENLKALNYHDHDHKKKYGYKGHHFDNNFHNHAGGHKKHYGHDGYHGHYQHHGHKSHKDGKHGHHHHSGYKPYHDHKRGYSYRDYDYNY